LAEVGLDSKRNGEQVQAETLSWQIQSTFSAGAAGLFLYAWTDEWYRGGFDIEDWDFGLTRRDRTPKPALATVQSVLAEVPFPSTEWPRVSVVVCSYNGACTISETLEHTHKLDYPNYEVIVVDDGSSDATAEIARRHGANVISVKNGGLSRARNIGMRAATGEIVAYVDDDAYPDPQWLQYLAHTFTTTNHAAVGGPNLPPKGDGPIAECVANAPGGPMHVLVSDQEAEHIPGCNMAFRRSALLALDGFDGQFRVAGDDVDLCWRILDSGWTIGFNPAAVVWHHRRNSVRHYLK
jgi:O-antigen biosynthesis protein